MEVNVAIAMLSGLAQDTRLRIFRLLVQAGASGLAAGEIAARLGIAAPTLSFHLKTLSHAGLVAMQTAGRNKIYRADYAAMNALLDYLTENCCGGAETCAVPNASTLLQEKNHDETATRTPRRARSG